MLSMEWVWVSVLKEARGALSRRIRPKRSGKYETCPEP